MENDILTLLQGAPGTRFSYKEVGRAVDRRQYRENLHWARPVLERLVYEGSIAKEDGLYFFSEEEVFENAEASPCTGGGGVGLLQTHELKVDSEETLERIEPEVSKL
jgi:hypothetical protein